MLLVLFSDIIKRCPALLVHIHTRLDPAKDHREPSSEEDAYHSLRNIEVTLNFVGLERTDVLEEGHGSSSK